jgi:acyl carrier protein
LVDNVDRITSVIDEIRNFIIQESLVRATSDDIGDETQLYNDLGMDSVAFAEVLGYLEDAYGVTVPDQDYTPANFRNLRSISQYVAAHQLDTAGTDAGRADD